MEKLSTIQKRNNLNALYRAGEIGPGGAYHEYEIFRADWPISAGTEPMAKITFQKGPRQEENSTPGILDVDLLEVVRDRLRAFQSGEFACRENACALTHIEEALMWMNKRVEDRAERNVLGTSKK